MCSIWGGVIVADYRDHPEYRALLAAVKAAPGDDLPRLVLADWLEENGEAERAALIRVMCAKHSRFVEFGSRDVGGGRWIWDSVKQSMPTYFKWKSVSRRVAKEAVNHLPTTEWRRIGTRLHRGFLHTVRAPLAVLVGGELCRWCHGRVEATPCVDCNGTGRTAGCLPELVRVEPVERVEATDREPDELVVSRMGWGWLDGGRTASGLPQETHHLTRDMYRLLAGGTPIPHDRTAYPTADAAKSALSAAIIRLAASQTPSEVQA
jgi:uncharacterized protein (TIGR02996 family)